MSYASMSEASCCICLSCAHCSYGCNDAARTCSLHGCSSVPLNTSMVKPMMPFLVTCLIRCEPVCDEGAPSSSPAAAAAAPERNVTSMADILRPGELTVGETVPIFQVCGQDGEHLPGIHLARPLHARLPEKLLSDVTCRSTSMTAAEEQSCDAPLMNFRATGPDYITLLLLNPGIQPCTVDNAGRVDKACV